MPADLLLVIALGLWTTIASAAEPPGERLPVVAVLTLQGTGVPDGTLSQWTELTRTAVQRTLGSNARVMTSGDQVALLRAKGAHAAMPLLTNDRELELLGILDTDYGFVGAVTRLESGRHQGVLTLYETRKRSTVGTAKLRAESDEELARELEKQAALLARRLPRASTSSPASTGSIPVGSGQKAQRAALVTPDSPVILGSLDKEIIRRVVREHVAEIRACYERELTKTPGLQGKVIMKWVVSGSGDVSRATLVETQLNDKGVEDCLAARIGGWKFPSPKGGGIVIVKYPFVFKPRG